VLEGVHVKVFRSDLVLQANVNDCSDLKVRVF
jgi:hypothetical protein